MEQMWRKLGVGLGKWWWAVIIGVLIVTAVFSIGASRIEFATGQDSYLNPESQAAIDNVEFQDQFGGEAVILLFSAEEGSTIADLMSDTNRAELERIEALLRAIPEVHAVVTPYTSMVFSSAIIDEGVGTTALLRAADIDTDPASSEVRALDSVDHVRPVAGARERPTSATGVGRAAAVGQHRVHRRRTRGHGAAARGTQHPQVAGEHLPRQADRGRRRDHRGQRRPRRALGRHRGRARDHERRPRGLRGHHHRLAGVPEGHQRLPAGRHADPRRHRPRRSWRSCCWSPSGSAGVCCRCSQCIIAVAWSFAFLGFIGIDLSLVTISGLPILIGIGVDFAIQVHNRVEEEVVLDRDQHPDPGDARQPRSAARGGHVRRRRRLLRAPRSRSCR